MTIQFYEELPLPNLGDLTKFIDFIDDISNPDELYNVIVIDRKAWEERPVAEFGSMHYPNLFDDLQKEVGVEPTIEQVLFFKFPANVDSTRDYIHKDRWRGAPKYRDHALTIPIQNCDTIKVYWYKDKDPEKTELVDTQVFIAANPDELIKVHEGLLNKPLLMETHDWHNIVANLDEPAYFVSVRFGMDFDCHNLLDGSP